MAEIKVDDEFILDIKRLGINGEGIGFYNKKAVFVNNAIPGEGVNVRVTEVKDKMVIAEALEIKHRVPWRVDGIDPKDYLGLSCAHIDYDKMLEFKRDLLIESLTRYSGLNPRQFQINDTLRSEETKGYRNKSMLPIRFIDMHMHTCMYKPNSNELVVVEDTIDQNPIINRLNKEILKLTEDLRIKAYNEKYDDGILRYISIRVNEKDEAMVTFVVRNKDNSINKLAKEVIKLDSVISVYETINDKKDVGNNLFGDEQILLEGKECIIITLGNIKYQVYPKTFFQLNTKQAKNMFDLIKKACKLSFKERVLDAYSGVGAISLYLAKGAKEVVGIEYNQASVDAAKKNAQLNKINNVSFYQGDSGELLEKKIKDGEVFDVVVVDPPRQGLDEKFIKTLLKTEVKRIVYASCNPQTLAKNLSKLSEKYNVKYITPLDMFPMTPLVESVTLLELKK